MLAISFGGFSARIHETAQLIGRLVFVVIRMPQHQPRKLCTGKSVRRVCVCFCCQPDFVDEFFSSSLSAVCVCVCFCYSKARLCAYTPHTCIDDCPTIVEKFFFLLWSQKRRECCVVFLCFVRGLNPYLLRKIIII